MLGPEAESECEGNMKFVVFTIDISEAALEVRYYRPFAFQAHSF